VIATTLWEIAAEHVVSFAFGVVVGFYASSRFRLVRRENGGTDAT
jgi:hypothetical protein